jgi:hypothetical protein
MIIHADCDPSPFGFSGFRSRDLAARNIIIV